MPITLLEKAYTSPVKQHFIPEGTTVDVVSMTVSSQNELLVIVRYQGYNYLLINPRYEQNI